MMAANRERKQHRHRTREANVQRSLVQLRHSDGKVVGTGFLISQTHIITCAHVIDDALIINTIKENALASNALTINTSKKDTSESAKNTHTKTAQDLKTAQVLGSTVTVYIPSVNQTLQGRVCCYQPTQTASADVYDIAVLELEAALELAPLQLVNEPVGVGQYRAVGFPAASARVNNQTMPIAEWLTASYQQLTAEGWWQFHYSYDYAFLHGASGGPVINARQQVVGMLVAADTAFNRLKVIPAAALMTAWPPLADQQRRRSRNRNMIAVASVLAVLVVMVLSLAGIRAHATRLEQAGLNAMQRGEPVTAVKAFQDSLRWSRLAAWLLPKTRLAKRHYNLAWALEETGEAQLDGVIHHYQQAVSLHPNDPVALNNLARAQLVYGTDTNSLNRSLQLLDRAVTQLTEVKTTPSETTSDSSNNIDGNNMTASSDDAATLSRIYKNIGWINLQLANLVIAEDALSTAITLDVRNAEAYCLQLELAQQSLAQQSLVQQLTVSPSADDLYTHAASCLIYAEQAPVLPSLVESARNYLRTQPLDTFQEVQLASVNASLAPHRVLALEGTARAEPAAEVGLGLAQPLLPGSHVGSDVILRLDDGARLWLLCQSGDEILVLAALQVNPCPRVPAWPSTSSGPPLIQLPAKGITYAQVLYPRYGAILSSRPQLRWQAVEGVNAYRVTVRYSDGELVWDKQTDAIPTDLAETELAEGVITRAYPDDVPALLPGVRYQLEVVAVLPVDVTLNASNDSPSGNSDDVVLDNANITPDVNVVPASTSTSSSNLAITQVDAVANEDMRLEVLNFSPLLAVQQDVLEQRLTQPSPNLDNAATTYRRALLYQQAGAYHAALVELAAISEDTFENAPTQPAELVLHAQLLLQVRRVEAARAVVDELTTSPEADVFKHEIAWLEHHLTHYSSTQTRF